MSGLTHCKMREREKKFRLIGRDFVRLETDIELLEPEIGFFQPE